MDRVLEKLPDEIILIREGSHNLGTINSEGPSLKLTQ
jgi:hypothetical protein